MKKITFGLLSLMIFVSLAFGLTNVNADTQCGDPSQSTASTTFQVCNVGNGPVIPEPTGWINIPDGVDGCPTWFPAGCVLSPAQQLQFGISLK